MSSTVIPRGVTVVKWKHKTDKTTQIKYRVRIVRKDYKADNVELRLNLTRVLH